MTRFAQGEHITRGEPCAFRFDGREFSGFAGDTLASALLANGVKLVGRSFKYHRPRGIFSAGPEEPNALVELRSGAHREPNTRATVTEIFAGLEANSQNHRGSLAFDIQSVTGVLAPFLGAGFYYKTFMWPAAFWERVYEPLIQRPPASAAPAPNLIQISTKTRISIAMCWSSAAEPQASPPRARPARAARASSSPSRISCWADGCFASPGTRPGARRRSPPSKPCPRSRSGRAPRSLASMIRMCWAPCSA